MSRYSYNRSLLSSNLIALLIIERKDNDLVKKEIEAWKGFEYALRKPNSSLFNQMLNECLENEEYAEAFRSKGSQFSAESLFMALIFQQQKMISGLIESLSSKQNKKD